MEKKCDRILFMGIDSSRDGVRGVLLETNGTVLKTTMLPHPTKYGTQPPYFIFAGNLPSVCNTISSEIIKLAKLAPNALFSIRLGLEYYPEEIEDQCEVFLSKTLQDNDVIFNLIISDRLQSPFTFFIPHLNDKYERDLVTILADTSTSIGYVHPVQQQDDVETYECPLRLRRLLQLSQGEKINQIDTELIGTVGGMGPVLSRSISATSIALDILERAVGSESDCEQGLPVLRNTLNFIGNCQAGRTFTDAIPHVCAFVNDANMTTTTLPDLCNRFCELAVMGDKICLTVFRENAKNMGKRVGRFLNGDLRKDDSDNEDSEDSYPPLDLFVHGVLFRAIELIDEVRNSWSQALRNELSPEGSKREMKFYRRTQHFNYGMELAHARAAALFFGVDSEGLARQVALGVEEVSLVSELSYKRLKIES